MKPKDSLYKKTSKPWEQSRCPLNRAVKEREASNLPAFLSCFSLGSRQSLGSPIFSFSIILPPRLPGRSMGITQEGPRGGASELTRPPRLTVDRARERRLQQATGPDSRGPSGSELGERKLRGHQGYESIARTDDTGGSETPKKGEGEEQLNKDTQGTAIPHE